MIVFSFINKKNTKRIRSAYVPWTSHYICFFMHKDFKLKDGRWYHEQTILEKQILND